MILNYLISALRALNRQKIFSAINLFGLSIAMAAVILVFMWVFHELSYDDFHNNAERIFRIEENQYYNNERYHVNVTPWPSGPVWESDIPEIEKTTRYTYTGSLLFRSGEQSYYEQGVISADSGFFRIFSFPFIYGIPETALDEPNSIVISEEIAERYFGDENPVGRIIEINNSLDYTITGVCKKIPANSSIRFDAVTSFDFMTVHTGRYSDNWGNNSIFTFALLNGMHNIEAVNEKLTTIVNLNKEENTIEFMLAPLQELHLYSYFGYGMQQRGIQNIYIFSAVGLFILVIACINFMNIATARATTRTREIGVRKITGAHRKDLIIQFLGESFLTTIIAFLFSLIIVLLLIPVFNLLTGKDFTSANLLAPEFLLSSFALIVITGFLSGIYPAFYLSSLLPVKILGASKFTPSGRGIFRKITVVIQFSLTIILIIGTSFIYGQLRYMQSKSLGYDKENLMYIPLRGDMSKSYYKLKEELVKLPVIENITATAHTPHQIGSNSGGVDWEGKDPDLQLLVTTGGADFDYVETMKIEMKSGRSFSKEYGTDEVHDTLASFIINEEMERIMGVDDAVGMQFHFMGMHGPVVGVMKNFHYQSARNLIEPLAFVVAPLDYLNFMVIRLSSGNIQDHLKVINRKWDELMPLYPFDYKFLDEEFDQLYRTEERMGRLMGYFSLVAIIIACIGLFGLSVFSAEQKTREIGIRKAHGASTSSILALFSREISGLLLVSAIISWPASYYIMNKWLQNFDYRIDLNLWIFLAAGIISYAIALLSIVSQAMKASLRNPADSLRYE